MIKKKILFAVSLLFGLMYINSGLNKFFNYMPMPKEMPEEMIKLFGAFMTIGWLMPLIAVFVEALRKYFDGEPDPQTLQRI